MGFQFDKSVNARLYRIGTQTTDTTVIRLAGTSVDGTTTTTPNPLVGAKMWNQVALVANLEVANSAGSSFTANFYANVNGTTYPAYRWISGPVAAGRYPVTNLCQAPYGPRPELIEIDETAGSGGLTASFNVIAKNYRGFHPGRGHGDKSVEGRVLTFSTIDAAATRDLVANPPSGGTFGATLGTEKFSLIDAACLFANITAFSGTWSISAIGTVAGNTVEVARTPNFTHATGGNTKVAFQNQFYGPLPRLTQLIFTTAGGNVDGITGHVDMIWKTNRGQRFKV